MQKEEDEKEKVIILDDEITPPVVGHKKDGPDRLNMTHDKEWLLKKAKQENGSYTSVAGLMIGKNGTWKKDNYIIGQRTPEDKKLCESVTAIDLFDTTEIRQYITAVEKFLTKKEIKRSTDEAKWRALKYFFCYAAGVTSVFWALYAGMINLVK